MSAITRGVVAAVLLAGAVAGAAAFPRFFAGPDVGRTPQPTLLFGGGEPAIVHAATLPLHVVRLPVIVPAGVAGALVAPIATTAELKPIVIHPVAPPRAEPAPAPAAAPPPAPAPAAAPAVVPANAPAVIPVAAAPAPPAAPAAATPAQAPRDHGRDHEKKLERLPASVEPLPSTNNGPPAQQAPPGTDSADSGAVRPVETPDAQAAPPDHGHGPPAWAHGGGKGQ